jgi:hypothetical protein
LKDKIKARGAVTLRVLDKSGRVKKRQIWHNVITSGGDALMADALLETPAMARVTPAGGGCVQVGTGWTGKNAKAAVRCNAPAGTADLEAGCPKLKAGSNAALIYKATFQAGGLDAEDINEAALMNSKATDAVCMAYAEIKPPVDVTPADTLQIIWEVTILGQ